MTDNNLSKPFIVVGVDGSESSIDALRWAAAQAKLTNCALRIVSTWQWPASFLFAPEWPLKADPNEQAKRALSEVIENVLGSDPGIEIQQFVFEGHPVPLLVDFAAKAELLVVGCRGRGTFKGMVLGSVSQHCLTHAKCPVVVMRHSLVPSAAISGEKAAS
jgi:nucleotide-binding universal stress UspA family protein